MAILRAITTELQRLFQRKRQGQERFNWCAPDPAAIPAAVALSHNPAFLPVLVHLIEILFASAEWRYGS